MRKKTYSQFFDACIAHCRQGRWEQARDTIVGMPVVPHAPAFDALRSRLQSLVAAGLAGPRPRSGAHALIGECSTPGAEAPRSSCTGQSPNAHLTGVADPCAPPLRANAPDTASALSLHPGVTLVTACMNRQANLLKVLPSWLATTADEVIIVDWSSTEPVLPMVAGFADPRIRVLRVEGEPRWILTHAFNLALRTASRETIYKLDCDIEVQPDFIEVNHLERGEFVRGYWRAAIEAGSEDQKYTNGTFGAFKRDLQAVGYFDERILTYGWDDSDLYQRLSHDRGLAGRLVNLDSLRHIEQEERQRLANQEVDSSAFLDWFPATQLEGARNKYLTAISLPWGSHFPAQEFASAGDFGGGTAVRRTTFALAASPARLMLADALAARELVHWMAGGLPRISSDLIGHADFAGVVRDAHRLGHGKRLVQALRGECGIHFVRCNDFLLREALFGTLRLVATHVPALATAMLIVEGDEGLDRSAAFEVGCTPCLVAPGALVDALADACQATPYTDIGLMEVLFAAGGGACTRTSISFDSIAANVVSRADRFAARLTERFQRAFSPTPATALVTSLYDEPNLIRLVEYLTATVFNVQVFERVMICYESRTGLLVAVLRRLVTQLGLDVGRVALLPYDARPTFAELFSVQRLLPPATTIAVTNADIVFDASFEKLVATPLHGTVAVLSRWDVDADGAGAALIRLENGSPNTLSADAWIVQTPFEPDFHLDYPIGTVHCDSFINNQLGGSARYGVINPCLEVRCFHLHDDRFNASAQKQVRDAKQIEEKYSAERSRNGNRDPVKGVAWTSLAGALLANTNAHLQHWRPKALVFEMSGGPFTVGSFLLLHLLRSCAEPLDDLVVVARLTEVEAMGPVGTLLFAYQASLVEGNLLVDICDRRFDADAASKHGGFTRRIDAQQCVAWVEKLSREDLQRQLREATQWPSIEGTKMVRTEVLPTPGTVEQLRLVAGLTSRFPGEVDSLRAFYDGLDPWSEQRRLLMPFHSDLFTGMSVAPLCAPLGMRKPIVSFVTSLYRGDDFLPGFLENVAVAAAAADGEVILVDANCDDHDTLAIEEFFRVHPEWRALFEVIRLDKDPGLYSCWQLAIEHARGEFITNANIDDRRSPQHTRRLVQALQRNPALAGGAGSISAVTHSGEGGWFDVMANQVWFYDLGDREFGFEDLFLCDAVGTVRSRNIMHCMPVWRRSLHEQFGFFDEERYGTSADWAFWLKCAKQGARFLIEPASFGRYFVSPQSHNRRNDETGEKERRIIADLVGVRQHLIVKQ